MQFHKNSQIFYPTLYGTQLLVGNSPTNGKERKGNSQHYTALSWTLDSRMPWSTRSFIVLLTQDVPIWVAVWQSPCLFQFMIGMPPTFSTSPPLILANTPLTRSKTQPIPTRPFLDILFYRYFRRTSARGWGHSYFYSDQDLWNGTLYTRLLSGKFDNFGTLYTTISIPPTDLTH